MHIHIYVFKTRLEMTIGERDSNNVTRHRRSKYRRKILTYFYPANNMDCFCDSPVTSFYFFVHVFLFLFICIYSIQMNDERYGS